MRDRSRRTTPQRPSVSTSLAGRGNLVRQAVSAAGTSPSAAAHRSIEALPAVDRPGVLLLELIDSTAGAGRKPGGAARALAGTAGARICASSWPCASAWSPSRGGRRAGLGDRPPGGRGTPPSAGEPGRARDTALQTRKSRNSGASARQGRNRAEPNVSRARTVQWYTSALFYHPSSRRPS